MLHRHLLGNRGPRSSWCCYLGARMSGPVLSLQPYHLRPWSSSKPLFLACTCTGPSLVDRRRRYLPRPALISAVPGPFSKANEANPPKKTGNASTVSWLHWFGRKPTHSFQNLWRFPRHQDIALTNSTHTSPITYPSLRPMSLGPVHYPPIGQSIFKHIATK